MVISLEIMWDYLQVEPVYRCCVIPSMVYSAVDPARSTHCAAEQGFPIRNFMSTDNPIYIYYSVS